MTVDSREDSVERPFFRFPKLNCEYRLGLLMDKPSEISFKSYRPEVRGIEVLEFRGSSDTITVYQPFDKFYSTGMYKIV